LKDVQTSLINFTRKITVIEFELIVYLSENQRKAFALDIVERQKTSCSSWFQINTKLAQKINYIQKFANVYFVAINLQKTLNFRFYYQKN
jgi:hypothetical protein